MNGKLPSGLQGMAQKMMQQAQEMEQQLNVEKVEGTAGGGAVKAVVNGKGEILDLTISKDVVDPNEIEMLQDLVITAVRDALAKANEMREQRMKSVIPAGFNIPGLM